MTFYLAAAVLALAAALALIRPLTAARGRALSRAEADAALHKAQLAEVDRDMARGAVSEAEARSARVEISRRLLGATRKAEETGALAPAPARLSRGLAIAAGVAIPALAAAAYLVAGAPAMPDRPYAERAGEIALAAEMRRPSQETAERLFAEGSGGAAPVSAPTSAEAEYRALVAQLEEVLADRPDDRRGRELQVQAYFRLGRNAEAWRVLRELIALKGEEATADDRALLVEGMVLAAGGYVSPEAETAITALVGVDPAHPVGLYYGGLVLAQDERLGEAISVWEALRAQLPDGSPGAEQLDGMLATVRADIVAGGGPGPDAAAIGAAAALTPEERMAMIETMVAGLEERLSAGGGPVEDWLRLIVSYRQLGRTDAAVRAYQAAAEDHAGDAAALATLRERTGALGLLPE